MRKILILFLALTFTLSPFAQTKKTQQKATTVKRTATAQRKTTPQKKTTTVKKTTTQKIKRRKVKAAGK